MVENRTFFSITEIASNPDAQPQRFGKCMAKSKRAWFLLRLGWCPYASAKQITKAKMLVFLQGCGSGMIYSGSGSGMIYFGSGSGYEFIFFSFRIRIRIRLGFLNS